MNTLTATMTEEALRSLDGRSSERSDSVDGHRWHAYFSFLGLDPEIARPLALHWLLFTELSPDLRPDGHPVRMEPFPELPFPRRMWAGGEIVWNASIAPGMALTRMTTVSRAQMKSGSAGDFLLASLQHALDTGGLRCVEERQDIVFLPQESRPGGGAVRGSSFEPEWSFPRRFGPVELFRYSALTFNSHRIHYDGPYAAKVEGYPGLVVQAPLLAAHLMHAAAGQRPGEIPARFAYRSVAPMFVEESCELTGKFGEAADELAVVGGDGRLRMLATMSFRRPEGPAA